MPTRPTNLHGIPPKQRGQSASSRGYNAAHRRRAKQVYGLPCLVCGEPADTANHPTPVARGGAELDETPEPYCLRHNSSQGAS